MIVPCFIVLLLLTNDTNYGTRIYFQSSHLHKMYGSWPPFVWFVSIRKTIWSIIPGFLLNLRILKKIWIPVPGFMFFALYSKMIRIIALILFSTFACSERYESLSTFCFCLVFEKIRLIVPRYMFNLHILKKGMHPCPQFYGFFCIWEAKWITIHRCSFNLRMFTKVWTALPRCFGVVIERRYTLLYPDIFVSGNGDATLAYSSFFLFTLAPSGSPTSWLVVPVFGDRVSGLPVSSPYFDYVIYSRSPLDTADWQSR